MNVHSLLRMAVQRHSLLPTLLTATCGMLLLTSCSTTPHYQVETLRVETEVLGSPTAASVTEGALSYVGTVEADEAIAVSFTGMGVIRRILVCEGQAVSRGQLLAEMDDTQARNLLRTAESQCTQAEDAIGRYSQLHDKGSLPEAKWIEAQSKLEQARASLEAARKNLADCRLTAPEAGIIGQRQMSAGQTALPSQPVVTLCRINAVKVLISVPEREVASITPSTLATVRVPAAGITTQGFHLEKGIVADPLTHTYPVRIPLSNPQHHLLPGMVCEVSLNRDAVASTSLNRGEAASTAAVPQPLTCPLRAVQQNTSGAHFVWTVSPSDSLAHRTPVTLGEMQGNRIQILSGIDPSTRIITAGYQKVSEGSRVTF